MKYINHNGKLLKAANAVIRYDNRAFKYGFGLFETMLFKNGVIRLKEYHFERLFTGMGALNIEMPQLYTYNWLEQQITETVRKNDMEKLCRIRLQVSTASGGVYDPDSQSPEFLVECFPLEPSVVQLNENGLQVGIAKDLAKSPDSMANLKSTNALIYVMAAQQAKANKWNDALVKNTNGNVIESTIANLFLIKDKIIYTPSLSEGCVSGVMRRHIINSLKNEGIEVLTKSISEEDLNDTDELFLSNAIRGIKWVASIGDHAYNNSYTKQISRLLFTKLV